MNSIEQDFLQHVPEDNTLDPAEILVLGCVCFRGEEELSIFLTIST